VVPSAEADSTISPKLSRHSRAGLFMSRRCAAGASWWSASHLTLQICASPPPTHTS